jgi:hypothetical protein
MFARTHLFQPARRAIVAAALVALSLLAVAPAANADVDPSRIYRITGITSLALDVEGGSYANEARVIQWGAHDGLNQQWRFAPYGNGTYQIVNRGSGRCLTIGGNSLYRGAGIVQYFCGGATNQRWYVTYPWGGSATIRLQVVSSGLYLDVPGYTANWGTQLIQWPFETYGYNQMFTLTQLA